jgi:hypothetical protein
VQRTASIFERPAKYGTTNFYVKYERGGQQLTGRSASATASTDALPRIGDASFECCAYALEPRALFAAVILP